MGWEYIYIYICRPYRHPYFEAAATSNFKCMGATSKLERAPYLPVFVCRTWDSVLVKEGRAKMCSTLNIQSREPMEFMFYANNPNPNPNPNGWLWPQLLWFVPFQQCKYFARLAWTPSPCRMPPEPAFPFPPSCLFFPFFFSSSFSCFLCLVVSYARADLLLLMGFIYGFLIFGPSLCLPANMQVWIFSYDSLPTVKLPSLFSFSPFPLGVWFGYVCFIYIFSSYVDLSVAVKTQTFIEHASGAYAGWFHFYLH